jgi:two-component system, cell cycle response regulator DivK
MSALHTASATRLASLRHAAPLSHLPASSDDEEGGAEPEVRRAPGVRDTTPVVLFADDNADTRELYAYYLAQQGYRVELAEDGVEALRKVGLLRPDIILMDLSMPGIDGWELTGMLKAAPHTRTIPIVVLTAHSHSADRERAYAAGCDGFLVKPVSPRALARAIAEELDRHRHD